MLPAGSRDANASSFYPILFSQFYVTEYIYIFLIMPLSNSFVTGRVKTVKNCLVCRAGATSASLNPIKESKITWIFTESVRCFWRQRRTPPRSSCLAFAQEPTCHQISLDFSSRSRQSFSNLFFLPEPQHTYPLYIKKEEIPKPDVLQ